MALLFFSSPAWQLVMQSDLTTKVVLIILLLASIMCGTLICAQFVLLYFVKKSSSTSVEAIKSARTVADLTKAAQVSDSYEATVVKKVLHEREKLLQVSSLQEYDMDLLLAKGDHEADALISQLETFVPVLGVSGAVAPLMGLFGTVWGLIHAFINISHEKSADIAVVAPGIAEALFTTMAGLVVAIPALIFFHYFARQVKKVDWQLRQVLELTILLIKKEQKS
ncbi:MotA/TolQ/ExbB proton channel family protein [Candidatus Babeliales bacterium]|nr:MotA/TolQ/ExbB proton channel family protein [Candidatus Babeliales bacterium]